MRTGPAAAVSGVAPVPAWRLALALSLGAAVSLGITRFAYGLSAAADARRPRLELRTGRRDEHQQCGRLSAWRIAARRCCCAVSHPATLMLLGSLAASVLMAVSGLFTDTTIWLLQRLAAGVASALVFMTGGLLAARLGCGRTWHAPAC